MTTKLFHRNSAVNAIGNFKDMLTTAGSGSSNAVVNTAASGTQIQWTKTAGGTALEFISGRVPAGGFTLSGVMTFSIWALESNMSANCGARARVFKRASGGTETEVGGGPWNDGVEFGTTNTEMVWTGTPTSTSFAENDRIIVRYYITNIGTMATGFTCTLNYDAADASTGDSFFEITENVTFKGEDQNISAAGAIASLETFGAMTIPAPAQSLTVTAIASLEAFGAARLNLNLAANGIASLEAFGSHSAVPGPVNVVPAGMASAETFGSSVIALVQLVVATGIESLEAFTKVVGEINGLAFNASAINEGRLNATATKINLTLIASATASAEAFGAGTVAPGPVTLLPSGIASVEAIGNAAVFEPSTTQNITGAGNMASLEAFGSHQLNFTLLSAGIASLEAFGNATLLRGTVTITPSAIATAEAFGSATVLRGPVTLTVSGIASVEAFGSHQLNLRLTLTGIGSQEAFGTPLFVRYVVPSGIASGEGFSPAMVTNGLAIDPMAIASAETFGGTTVVPGPVSLVVFGISSAEAFGGNAFVYKLIMGDLVMDVSYEQYLMEFAPVVSQSMEAQVTQFVMTPAAGPTLN